MSKPYWMNVGLRLWPKAMQIADGAFSETNDPQSGMISRLAVFHLATCMETANFANQNQNNFYSVAVCLLRQCVETLSVIDLALQEPEYSRDRLRKWENSKLSPGELRKALESDVWPRYGSGLWGEPWREFFANLAGAVQPYAHYTPDLLGWQIKVARDEGDRTFLANLAPRAHDPIRTARVAVLQAIVTWTFARLLLMNRPKDALRLASDTDQLSAALRDSKLLWAGKDWAAQLMPHVMYGPQADWKDE